MAAAMAYVKHVTRALVAAHVSEYGSGTRRVWVADHDYGPLMTGQGGFGMFPEIALVVETTEV